MKRNTDRSNRFDLRILNELRKSARLSMAELAQRVGLSKSPVLARVRRLERDGYILAYRAELNAEKLGLAQVAFVQVTLSDTTTEALEAFDQAARAASEIEQCHMIAGGFDYLLKVQTADVASYRKAFGETLAHLPHVTQTSTYIAMEIVKE